MEPVLTAEAVIERALKASARHVRILSIVEGALALAVAAGGFVFFEIILDHLFALGAGLRTALFVALVTLVGVVFGWLILAPLVKSVSRLYIAKRIEAAFPDFKNSLVTFVQLKESGDEEGIVRLVAYQAAMRFEGVDIDAGLDSTRFVKLGYCFVALVVGVFAYSLFTPKSMWTSLLRAVYPNAGVAAPTSTHIGGVKPGNARVLLGADVEVSAEVTGGGSADASIRWSRDGELWQSAPMQESEGRFAGTLAHVETNTLYYISAGDASSGKYTITTLVPPLVESVEVELTPPAYTGMETFRTTGGNIEGPAGSRALVEIGSNKDLSSVAIRTSDGQTLELAVSGRKATGRMPVERSGRYAVVLTDSEGLSPARPVEYDIVAIPDRPPLVGVKGPPEKDAVGLDEALGCEFEASDDYGLARLVFHFESNPSNADVKNFILPEGEREVDRSAELVPRLMGATAGDTVSYYLEAFDRRDGKPNASRTATYTFKVAAGGEPLSPSGAGAAVSGAGETKSTFSGAAVAASGEAERKSKGQTNLAAPADSPNAKPAGDAKGELLKMLDKDRETWETIAKHYESTESASGAVMQKAAEKEIADGAGVTQAPGTGSEPLAGAETVPAGTVRAETVTTGGQERSGQGVEGKREAGSGEKGASLDGETLARGSQESPVDAARRPGSKASDAQKGGETAGSSAEAERGGSKAAASPLAAGSGQSQRGAGAEVPKGAMGQSSGSSGAGAGVSEAGATAQGGGKGSAGGKPREAGTSKQAAAGGSSGKSGHVEAGAAARAPAGTEAGAASSITEATEDESRAPTEAHSASGTQVAASTPQAWSAPGASPTPGASGGSRSARPVDEAAAVTGERTPLEPRKGSVTKIDEARIAATRELVKRLTRDIATGRVDPGAMKDLGWQPSQLRTFVRKYADALAEVAPAPLEGQITIEGGIDAGEVRQGERAPGAVGSVDTGGNAAREVTGPTGDKIPREEVAPQYRKTVDEYYRSLAKTEK